MNCPTVSLSIVVPVFGCAPCLAPLYKRLRKMLDGLGENCEIIFVDDGTRDGSNEILSRLASKDPCVRVHRLDENSGQHAAIVAGLSRSKGARVAIMDCDLQHPPETLPRFVHAARGTDIVLGVREADDRSGIRYLASRAFRCTAGSFRRFPNNRSYGTFSMLSRRAVEDYLGHADAGRGYLVVLDRLDLSFSLVDYPHGERYAGRSAYTLPRLVRHAVNSRWNVVRLLVILAVTLAVLAFGILLGRVLIDGVAG